MRSLFLALCLFTSAVMAQDGPRLPPEPEAKSTLPNAPKPTTKFPGNDLNGIGASDPRVTVDQSLTPWRAIGRLQTGSGICTASLIGPSHILTAAHCVFDPRSHQPYPAKAFHFMLGYSDGRFATEGIGVQVTIPDQYDPSLGIATMGYDWAIIELDRVVAFADVALPMRDEMPQLGEAVALGGYSKDHAEQLMVDTNCRVVQVIFDRGGKPLVRHTCTGTHGVSGAPLLVRGEWGWAIGGIDVVATTGTGGAAVVLTDVRARWEKLIASHGPLK